MDQLRALRVFVRVVAEGSFAGAARALDLAPAGVTRAVAELEQHLGARLLNRSTRRLALTEIGAAYLDHARRILAELDEADALAGAATAQPRGSLRVLCPPAFAVHQLAPLLPRFRERHPQLAIELVAAGAVEAADEHFDLSIVSVGAQGLQGDFVARRLARSTFVLCAAPAYLGSCGVPSEPDDLLRHRAILPATAAVRRELTLYRCDADALERTPASVTIPAPPAALTTAHLDTMRAAALAGLGIAGLSSFIACEALRDGRLVRVLPAWRGIVLTLYAAMPGRRHLPARTRALCDFLVHSFGGRDEDPWLAAAPSKRA